MTKRLFLALNATDPLADTFLPTLKKLKINADRRDMTMKWVPVDNYHVTVTFLGDTPEEDIHKVAETLAEVCTHFAPFELKIEDVGAFSQEHDARVLWLGVQNKRYLGEFKEALDQELVAKNLLTREERSYSPHLTIGRLRNPRSVKDMISPFKRKSFGKIQVDEIVLYESTLQGAFPVYKPLARCKLTGKANLADGVPVKTDIDIAIT
ncbi:RNA 2',3'-cyclic phosphodiesterase [Bdellovibrio bacteriovorus]|uniref:RNA 2',3'-cyclic phosphodiesterase n=1 Tax=Bdellovibrio bacteriovorus TaxID=959 RepID=UPI0021D36541|nr:RNA 2',3'-cyclic phosphodiesterase [Bdellovibrio bacteriovorus]UXR64529.1 RNA 2',3'-cyclic phosphodiesterase [Bdellovibrio bacteriovorus]